jgi:hypothetical protein
MKILDVTSGIFICLFLIKVVATANIGIAVLCSHTQSNMSKIEGSNVKSAVTRRGRLGIFSSESKKMESTNIKTEKLVAEIEALKNLDRSMRYLEQHKFPLHLMDVVAQDEFSHDVLIPFAEPPTVLVLSVT